MREVVLRRGLELAFHLEDFVERHAGLFVLLALEVAVPELEAVLVAAGLRQLAHPNLLKLFGRRRVVLALVVVVGEFPARLEGERALRELRDERLHAVHRVAVVQRQRAHRGVVVGFDIGVARGAGRLSHQRLEGVQRQGVLVVLVGLDGAGVLHGVGVRRRGPLAEGGGLGNPNHPHHGRGTKKGMQVGHGVSRIRSKLPSLHAGVGRGLRCFSTRTRGDFALLRPRLFTQDGKAPAPSFDPPEFRPAVDFSARLGVV